MFLSYLILVSLWLDNRRRVWPATRPVDELGSSRSRQEVSSQEFEKWWKIGLMEGKATECWPTARKEWMDGRMKHRNVGMDG